MLVQGWKTAAAIAGVVLMLGSAAAQSPPSAAGRGAELARVSRPFGSLILHADVPSAGRWIRRWVRVDAEAIAVRPPDLRLELGASWSAARDRLVAESAKATPDAHFVLGCFLLWSGSTEQGRALLRLHDLRVGGDAVARTLFDGEADAKPAPRSLQLALVGHTEAALTHAIIEDAATSDASTRGRVLCLLLSNGMIEGADRLLGSRAATLDLAWPVTREGTIWKNSGLIVGLAAARGRDGMVVPTPAAALSMTALGFPDVARALANEATNSELSEDMKRLWSWVLAQTGESLGAADPSPLVLLQKSGVLPEWKDIGKALKEARLGDAARMLNRLPQAAHRDIEFSFLRGLALLLAGRDADALEPLATWLMNQAEFGSLAPALGVSLPADSIASLSGPIPAGESLARLIVRFGLIQQAKGDLRDVVATCEIAYPSAAGVHAAMRKLAGPAIPTTMQGKTLRASSAIELGDIAFRGGEYEKANEKYLDAGQLDERTNGLPHALLRGAFAVGDFDRAGQQVVAILATLGDPSERSARAFQPGVRAAYGIEADFQGHLAALVAQSIRKPLVGRLWFLRAMMEIEAGQVDEARRTLESVKRIDAGLTPWASAFLDRLKK